MNNGWKLGDMGYLINIVPILQFSIFFPFYFSSKRLLFSSLYYYFQFDFFVPMRIQVLNWKESSQSKKKNLPLCLPLAPCTLDDGGLTAKIINVYPILAKKQGIPFLTSS